MNAGGIGVVKLNAQKQRLGIQSWQVACSTDVALLRNERCENSWQVAPQACAVPHSDHDSAGDPLPGYVQRVRAASAITCDISSEQTYVLDILLM